MSTIKDCVAPNAALNSLASYDRPLVNASLFSNVLEPNSPVALSCNDVIDNADKLSYLFHNSIGRIYTDNNNRVNSSHITWTHVRLIYSYIYSFIQERVRVIIHV